MAMTQFEGEGDHYGNVEVASGNTSVASQGFSGSGVGGDTGQITQPDDVVQTETGNFPHVVDPNVGKAYEGRETGDVGP